MVFRFGADAQFRARESGAWLLVLLQRGYQNAFQLKITTRWRWGLGAGAEEKVVLLY